MPFAVFDSIGEAGLNLAVLQHAEASAVWLKQRKQKKVRAKQQKKWSASITESCLKTTAKLPTCEGAQCLSSASLSKQKHGAQQASGVSLQQRKTHALVSHRVQREGGVCKCQTYGQEVLRSGRLEERKSSWVRRLSCSQKTPVVGVNVSNCANRVGGFGVSFGSLTP